MGEASHACFPHCNGLRLLAYGTTKQPGKEVIVSLGSRVSSMLPKLTLTSQPGGAYHLKPSKCQPPLVVTSRLKTQEMKTHLPDMYIERANPLVRSGDYHTTCQPRSPIDTSLLYMRRVHIQTKTNSIERNKTKSEGLKTENKSTLES